MIYPKGWEKVTCRAWYEDEKKIWLCLENKNAICEVDKNSKKTKVLGMFPHNGLGEAQLSFSVEKIEDFIVFSPYKANDIAILRISTGELEFIDLTNLIVKDKTVNEGLEKFYRMYPYKRYLLFFGINYPVIMRLDLVAKKLDFFDGWLKVIERYKHKEDVFFTDGYALKGNKIYLPIGGCSGVLNVDLDTMDWSYKELGISVRGILGMSQQGNIVWLTERNMNAKIFFQWNIDNDQIKEIELPAQDAFYAPIYYKNSLFLFRNYGKRSFQYGLRSGKWRELTNNLPETVGSGDKKVCGEDITYFSKYGRFYRWNPETQFAYFDEFIIEDHLFLKDSWADYSWRCAQKMKNNILKEGKISGKDFINVVGLIDNINEISFNNNGCRRVGEDICIKVLCSVCNGS